MDTAISVQQVGVKYKQSRSIFKTGGYHDALVDISFDIRSGETIGILGRNGSGKSTLLKVISGVLKPDTGQVINHGASISLLALQVGFDVNLSGSDNAVLTGILQGYSYRQIKKCLNSIRIFSELGDFFDEPVKFYSTGMRSRLAFSISQILQPDVLLIDEVLSVGDLSFRQKAEKAMLERINSHQTIVLVTHSHQQVARLCDRVVLISNGGSQISDDVNAMIAKYQAELGV